MTDRRSSRDAAGERGPVGREEVRDPFARRPEREPGASVVPPKPAATAVLLRPGGGGFETLLTRRPSTMRFGPDLHVFPGGRLDPEDADAAAAAIRETAEETGIVLARDDLVPMTRWVTPPGFPYRFDVRFFAAFVARGTEVSGTSDEVVDSQWLAPRAALEARAGGELLLWQPTTVTLQQIEPLADRAALTRAFTADHQPMRRPSIEELSEVEAAVTQPWAAGIEGRTAVGRLVGRRELVVIDPSDPTGETTEAILAWAAARGATVVGVAVTDLDPVHHAGVEMFAAGYGIPVVAGVGASRLAPYPVTELVDGERLPFGDVEVTAHRVLEGRPEALRFVVGAAEVPKLEASDAG